MDEIGEITEHVQEEAGCGTDLIWGNCKDESLGEKIMITLIATGFREGGTKRKEVAPEKVKVSLESERVNEIVEEDYTVFDFDTAFAENVVDFDTDDVKKTINMLGVKSEDPFVINRGHLTEELKKKSEADAARREYLRKTNSKPLDNSKIIADMENVPAYARRNVMLDETNKRILRNAGYVPPAILELRELRGLCEALAAGAEGVDSAAAVRRLTSLLLRVEAAGLSHVSAAILARLNVRL